MTNKPVKTKKSPPTSRKKPEGFSIWDFLTEHGEVGGSLFFAVLATGLATADLHPWDFICLFLSCFCGGLVIYHHKKTERKSLIQRCFALSFILIAAVILCLCWRKNSLDELGKNSKLELDVYGLTNKATKWEELGSDSSLHSGEHFYLRTKSFTPGYVYVFELDSANNVQWLFPDPADTNFNAAVQKEVPITIPSDPRQAFALDTNTGTESFYAIYSATPWREFEDLWKKSNASLDSVKGDLESFFATNDLGYDMNTKGSTRDQGNQIAQQPVGKSLMSLPSHNTSDNGLHLLEIRRFHHVPVDSKS